MSHVLFLPSGSRISVHPPDWDGVKKRTSGEDILYFMEVRSPSGDGYVYSRDRDQESGDFPDLRSFCDDLVREKYTEPVDVPAVVEFLALDPEAVSLVASVMLT